MYNERKDNFLMRDLLLQILFVVIFVFILMWIFPTKKQLEGLIVDNSGYTPTYDNVFNENILNMKDAAKSYYTTPRLPKEVGDKVSMTLGEMENLKIILPFTDSKGRSCDKTKSYVEVTKKEEEFIMKINLKCPDEENYLLVYMGCYDYCKTTICEKNEKDVKTPVINPTNPKPTPKPTPTPAKKCAITNCPTGHTLVNKDSADCYCKKNPTPAKKCAITSCPSGHTLVNKDSADCYCKKDPVKEYICEYLKVTNPSYSEWGAWSEYSETPAIKTVLKDVRTTTKTVKKEQTVLVGYKTITYYDENKPLYETVNVKVGTKTTKTCAKYETTYVNTGSYEYGQWKSNGTKVFSNKNVPADTATTKYVFVKTQYNANCGLCANGIEYVYEVFTRTQIPVKKEEYKCTQWTSKTEDVYASTKVLVGYGTSTKKEPVYEKRMVDTNVTLYSYRTRTLIQGSKDVKWDTCNNSPLVSQGYTFTGNKKEK